MKLLLSECPEGHKQMALEATAEALDLGALIETRGPVSVTLDVERRGDQLAVRGTARVILKASCARCAQPVERLLEGEILAFADRRGKDEPRDEAALEQEGSILYHDGMELTLTDPIREAVLLEEPAQVLCREDCKGLCPQCGSDLNLETCSCASRGVDPRWEALKNVDPGTSRGDG